MKGAFAAGLAAGVAVVLMGALVHAARREPKALPEAAAPAPATSRPAETSAADLAAARARIGVLEAEIAKAKRLAAEKAPALSRLQSILKRHGGVLPDPSEKEAEWRKVWVEFQVFVADIAEERGLSTNEASLEPGAWMALLSAHLESKTPPLTTEQRAQVEALKKRYDAEWGAYVDSREGLLGVERRVAQQKLFESAYGGVKEIVGEDEVDEGALDVAWSNWPWASSMMPSNLNVYDGTSDDELIGKIGQDWAGALALRPDQQDGVAALVGDYIKAVRAAIAGAPGDPNSRDPEIRAMSDIQHRMAAALRLDAGQLDRLRNWATLPGIDGRK